MRRRLGLALLAAGTLVLVAANAQARTETVRWQHSKPGDVASFTIHFGTRTGQPDQQVPVGKPAPSGGVYTYDLQVPDTQTVFISVSARGTNGLRSPRSNERRREAPSSGGSGLGRPGQPRVVGP